MLGSCVETIARELHKAMKEKMILIVVVVIPLAVNLILGAVLYNSQIKSIPMAVADQDNSSLSRMIVQQFRENETFNIKYEVESAGELKGLLDDSKARVGMVIPRGFSRDINALKSPTLLMLYDGSHISIASAAKSRASEILLTIKTGILLKLEEGKLNLPGDAARKLALDINFSSRTLYNPTKSFKDFLIPGLGTAIVQTGIALMGAVAVRPGEVRRRKRKRIGYVIGKILFYGGLGTVSLVCALLIQKYAFGVPFKGSFKDVLLLSFAFACAVAAFSISISSWIKNEMLATTINAVIFIPNTIMVGYTWPVMSMPGVYQALAKFFPFYHYADDIRDLCLKGRLSVSLGHEMEWLIRFAVIAFLVALAGVWRLKVDEAGDGESVFERIKLLLSGPAAVEEGD